MKRILVFLLIALGIVAIDAVVFTMNLSQRIDAAVLPLDNDPLGDLSCPIPSKCAHPSINAECYVMACQAKKCGGDYSSGECKSLKDAYEAAHCELLASPGCGDKLPSILLSTCDKWWQYTCRIRLRTGIDQVYTP